MKAIRERLGVGSATASDRGLTLIEVVVAMMIFTIIATGLLYSMMSVLTLSRDSRARQVATNIAAEEIDLVRDYENVFDVLPYTTPQTRAMNNDVFTVTRDTEWVSNPDDVARCGAGVGTLRYKQVRITVEWENMRTGSTPVTSDTLISPNSRINDPEKGTILVMVKNAVGEGAAGIPVWAKRAGSPALTTTTDSHGCAYLLMVSPGTYEVGLTSPSGQKYVDNYGNLSPVSPEKATVVAGKTVSREFAYELAGILSASFMAESIRPLLPRDLKVTLMSTRDPVVSVVESTANPTDLLVFPWPDGNSLVAGNAVQCLAHDPQEWPSRGDLAAGQRPGTVAAASAPPKHNTVVPAGAVQVNGITSGSDGVLKAVSQNVVHRSGQPSCITEQTYYFAVPSTHWTTTYFALPYGSWRLYSGGSEASANTAVNGNRISVVGEGGINSDVVTLDPRIEEDDD